MIYRNEYVVSVARRWSWSTIEVWKAAVSWVDAATTVLLGFPVISFSAFLAVRAWGGYHLLSLRDGANQ